MPTNHSETKSPPKNKAIKIGWVSRRRDVVMDVKGKLFKAQIKEGTNLEHFWQRSSLSLCAFFIQLIHSKYVFAKVWQKDWTCIPPSFVPSSLLPRSELDFETSISQDCQLLWLFLLWVFLFLASCLDRIHEKKNFVFFRKEGNLEKPGNTLEILHSCLCLFGFWGT